MDELAAYFPYESYRPHQREMLEAVAVTARDGGIAMIDAPTGSGKSSVVSALLAERRGRTVVIAVRTVSQLATFVRELTLVRKRRPELRFAYLIGKGQMCRLGGRGDVYRRCEGLKSLSTALLRSRAEAGSLNPSRDQVVRLQIKKNTPDHPLVCPAFIHSRAFSLEEGAGLRMVPSAALRARAERVGGETVSPEDLPAASGDCCPYEVMLQAARGADVVLLNFHHVLDATIREQLYLQLGLEAGEVLLLVDEAHNLGDAVQSVQSVALGERGLEGAEAELLRLRGRVRTAEAAARVLPQVRRFMELLRASRELEDWFDPAIFERMVVQGSLYPNMAAIVDDLLEVSDAIRERNKKAGEFRESAVERLTTFLYRIFLSAHDPAYLTVYRRDGEEVVLEVRNIDPQEKILELARSHAATVLISGTLSPVDAFRRLYFGDEKVAALTLPNAFPRDHRMVVGARDVTTLYSMRDQAGNRERIAGYIAEFARLPGNLAIYFPSYQVLSSFADLCAGSLRGKEVIVEPRDPADASAALRTFLGLPAQGKAGVIFAVCGGKWSEGLDYRGELLQGAMVVGLPLAPFTRVRSMVIDYFRRKFGDEGEFLSYTLPAMNRALQALGRVIRSPEDRGFLVLCEQRFMEAQIRGALPAWIREEMAGTTLEGFGGLVDRWR
ncbi:MAG TPA: ATP-dependent DNA helicase [Methanomicrobiales archaeon]|nr:ATP-dependent DNA helicase [Methanomicrobiales archaeon]